MRRPVGCDRCRGAGYAGRIAVAEVLHVDAPGIGEAILARADAATLRRAASAAGMTPLLPRATELVARGVTSAAEVVRVFGLPPIAPPA